MAITVSQLIGNVIIVGAEDSTIKLEGVGRATESAGAKLGLLAAGAVVVAGAALIAFGAKAAQMAGNFQQGMNRLVTGAGDVTDNMQKMGQGILGISIDTGQATSKLLQAMYLILSSGQRGAQALNTLSVAARGAVIEQASVVDVANVLSGVMTNYGTKVFNATAYMNGLMKAVSLGKITLQDLAVAMGPIDPIAKHLGVSFSDLAAAMTTQTNAMIPAHIAATGLRFLMQGLENPTKKATDAMKAMGLNSIAVAEEMKKSLPDALQMIYNAARKAGPEGSVPFNRALADMVGGIRGTTAFMALTGPHMKDFAANAAAIAAAMRSGATQITGWNVAQGNFNVQMSRAWAAVQAVGINLGTLLLPGLTHLAELLVPIITGFAQWFTASSGLPGILKDIGDAFQAVFNPIKLVQQAAAPLLDTFDRASAIFPALHSAIQPLSDTFDRAKSILQETGHAAAPLLDTFDRATAILGPMKDKVQAAHQAFNPFIPLFQGIATAIRITITVFQTVATVIRDVAGFFQHYIWPVLQLIGTFLVATFTPVWKELVQVWNSEMLPALKEMWGALQPLLPVLKLLAGLILGVVVVAIGIFVGILVGVIKALAAVLIGVVHFAGQFVGIFRGAVQLVSGLIQFFVDLATGKFNKLWGDIGTMLTGVKNLFGGFFGAVGSLFGGFFSALGSLVHGFIDGVIGFFTHLKDILIGHSIIPDIVNGILRWFGQLPGKLLSLGVQMIQGLISGIWSQAGNLANALGSMVHNAVGNIPGLGGILSNLHILGYQQGGPVLQTGLAMVHKGEYVIPAGGFPASRMPSSSGYGAGSAQPIILQINGYTLARLLMPHIVSNIRNNVGVTNL